MVYLYANLVKFLVISNGIYQEVVLTSHCPEEEAKKNNN